MVTKKELITQLEESLALLNRETLPLPTEPNISLRRYASGVSRVTSLTKSTLSSIALTTEEVGSKDVNLGFSVTALLLALINVALAIRAMIEGRASFTPTKYVKLSNAAVMLALVVLAIAIPAIAIFIGLATASIGILFASYQLGRVVYGRWLIAHNAEEIETQKEGFRAAIQTELTQVTALSEDERPKEDNSALLQRISKQMKDIEDWQRLKTVNLSIAQKWKPATVVLRTVLFLLASVALAGAILFLFNPFVATIIALTVTAIGLALFAYQTGKIVRAKWNLKEQQPAATKSELSVAPELSPQQSPNKAPTQSENFSPVIPSQTPPHPKGSQPPTL